MTTNLLLLATTVASLCDLIALDGRLNSSLHQYISSVSRERRIKDFEPFKAQRKENEKKFKDVTKESTDCNQNFYETVFKTDSVRRSRVLPQNNIILKDRQAVQIFEDVVSGSRRKRQVVKDYDNVNRTWQDGVYYTFNTSDPILQKTFKMGAKVWSDNTCIDFIEDNNATDKVVVLKASDGFSRIGRFGGDQPLALFEGASVGDAVHEIGHALGFYHTQSRFDRDNYILFIPQNIDPNRIDDFYPVSDYFMDVFGMAYDYGSVMHYSEILASINGLPTMIARNPYYQRTMGSNLISFSDIYQINQRYGCNAKCNKSTSAKCKNEGFPHPRNCSTCICPSGYGSTLCDQRPPGCGEYLMASREEKWVDCKLGSGSTVRDHFDFCNYMILAPAGTKIVVEVRAILPTAYESSGCVLGGIEIKAQKDQKMTGYRYSEMRAVFTYRYTDEVTINIEY